MRKFFSFFFICFSLFALADDALFVPQTVMNPKNNTEDGFVSDVAHYMSDGYKTQLNDICRQVREHNGVEIAVVMLPQMDRSRYDGFSFCQELFNLWGIGDREHNLGVLVFFCDGEDGRRDIRIHTSTGIEPILTDALCSYMIDNVMDDLRAGHYEVAVVRLVMQIVAQVMDESNQQQMLFGWRPYEVEVNGFDFYYVCICCLLLIVFACKLRKDIPLNGNEIPLSERSDYDKLYQMNGRTVGLLSFLFPLTLPFLYIYIKRMRVKVRQSRLSCPNCKHEMQIISAVGWQDRLSPIQRTEERIRSREYDLWHCSECGAEQVVGYAGKKESKYSICSQCGAVASAMVMHHVVTQATSNHSGVGEKEYVCECCNHRYFVRYTIPKLAAPVAGSGSHGGSHHGGSYSSGGSWGGGSSRGGGAGRSF